ncbi:MAG: hypothetical protein RLZZ524_1478, partial [Pseudomonadota bacterium]
MDPLTLPPRPRLPPRPKLPPRLPPRESAPVAPSAPAHAPVPAPEPASRFDAALADAADRSFAQELDQVSNAELYDFRGQAGQKIRALKAKQWELEQQLAALDPSEPMAPLKAQQLASQKAYFEGEAAAALENFKTEETARKNQIRNRLAAQRGQSGEAIPEATWGEIAMAPVKTAGITGLRIAGAAVSPFEGAYRAVRERQAEKRLEANPQDTAAMQQYLEQGVGGAEAGLNEVANSLAGDIATTIERLEANGEDVTAGVLWGANQLANMAPPVVAATITALATRNPAAASAMAAHVEGLQIGAEQFAAMRERGAGRGKAMLSAGLAGTVGAALGRKLGTAAETMPADLLLKRKILPGSLGQRAVGVLRKGSSESIEEAGQQVGTAASSAAVGDMELAGEQLAETPESALAGFLLGGGMAATGSAAEAGLDAAGRAMARRRAPPMPGATTPLPPPTTMTTPGTGIDPMIAGMSDDDLKVLLTDPYAEPDHKRQAGEELTRRAAAPAPTPTPGPALSPGVFTANETFFTRNGDPLVLQGAVPGRPGMYLLSDERGLPVEIHETKLKQLKVERARADALAAATAPPGTAPPPVPVVAGTPPAPAPAGTPPAIGPGRLPKRPARGTLTADELKTKTDAEL